MTNYYYNGVKLPALPEWDRETYPYAIIDDLGSYYRLFITNHRWHQNESIDPVVTVVDDERQLAIVYQYNASASENWVLKNNLDSNPNYDSSTTSPIIWSNHDIIRESDNSLYLAASTPILVGMTNFDQGLILGLTMPWWGSVEVAGEATMYSYNGVILPKLPEWDREKYPYAVIQRSTLMGIESMYLWVLSVPAEVYGWSDVGSLSLYPDNKDMDAPHMSSLLPGTGDGAFGEWQEFKSGFLGGVPINNYYNALVWANHDIYYHDQLSEDDPDYTPSYVYLAASDPARI